MKKGPKTFPSGLHKDFSLTTANRYIRLAKTKISIKLGVSIEKLKKYHLFLPGDLLGGMKRKHKSNTLEKHGILGRYYHRHRDNRHNGFKHLYEIDPEVAGKGHRPENRSLQK